MVVQRGVPRALVVLSKYASTGLSGLGSATGWGRRAAFEDEAAIPARKWRPRGCAREEGGAGEWLSPPMDGANKVTAPLRSNGIPKASPGTPKGSRMR